MRKCANGSDIFCTSISFFLLAPGTCPNPPFIVFFFAWWHVLCNVQKSGFAAQTNTPENPEKHVKPLKRCLLTSPQIIFFSLGTCPKPREKRVPMHVISNWQTWLEGISEKALFLPSPARTLTLGTKSMECQFSLEVERCGRRRESCSYFLWLMTEWWLYWVQHDRGKSSRDLFQDISVRERLCLIPPWKKTRGSSTFHGYWNTGINCKFLFQLFENEAPRIFCLSASRVCCNVRRGMAFNQCQNDKKTVTHCFRRGVEQMILEHPGEHRKQWVAFILKLICGVVNFSVSSLNCKWFNLFVHTWIFLETCFASQKCRHNQV